MKPLKLIATHFDTKNKKYLAPYGKEGDAQIYLAYSSDGVNFTRTHYKFENIISLEQVKRIEPKQDKKEMLSFLEYVKDKSPELSGFIEKLGLESVLNDLPTPEEIVQKKLSKEKVMGLFLSDILPKIQKNIQEKAQEDPSTIVQILEEMQNMQSPEEDSEEDEEENVIIHNGKRYVLDQEQDEEG